MATIRVANAQLWTHDQEEALEFWTKKVGFEVRADISMPELGDFRWLTVGPAGQDDFSIALLGDRERRRPRLTRLARGRQCQQLDGAGGNVGTGGAAESSLTGDHHVDAAALRRARPDCQRLRSGHRDLNWTEPRIDPGRWPL